MGFLSLRVTSRFAPLRWAANRLPLPDCGPDERKSEISRSGPASS
jgi:hypothetical protein